MYMVTVLSVGLDKSGQVRTGVKYFSSTVSPTLFKFGPPPNLRAVSSPYLARNSTTLPSGGIMASSHFSWRKVWTGVKCHFSSADHHNQYVVGKLSISRVRMWNFTRIGRKTKKVTAFQKSSTKAVAWNHPQKGVNYHFSSLQLDKPCVIRKLSILEA